MDAHSGRDPRVDKHEQILDKLVEQQIRIEEMLKVQIRRADIQEAALKEKSDADNKKELKLAETLATIGQSMSMLKWVAGIIGGTLILNLAQHFFPK
jgi:hypothetical protein